jgi:hypothetical protein
LVSGLKWARDLEIEPGGQTMLIAVYNPGQILRYNFATGATTVLVKEHETFDGIAYDPYGTLSSCRSQHHHPNRPCHGSDSEYPGSRAPSRNQRGRWDDLRQLHR